MGCCQSPGRSKPISPQAFYLSNNSVEVVDFNLLTGSYKSTYVWNSPLPPGAQYCTLPTGVLFATGGHTRKSQKSKGPYRSSRAAACYDPAIREFAQKPDMCTGRESHAMAVEGRGVYALSGLSGLTTTPLCERWDTVEEVWEEIEPVPEARAQASACVACQRIYLTGGQDLLVQSYHLAVGQWAAVKFKLPVSLRNHGSAEYKGGVLVFGGERADGSPNLTTFWFSAKQQRILQKASLPLAALFPCHCLSNGEAVFACEQASGQILFVFSNDRWVLRPLQGGQDSWHNG